MIKKNEKIDIINPINQKNLFGYSDYFNLLRKIYEKGKLPNCILLSGQKGIGKATFAYHFINFILSKDLEKEYLLENFEISDNSLTYNRICTNTHPNFYLIDSNSDNEDIKIEKTRDLLKFLSKTTYSKNLKIVLIDNLEKMNLNSSNSLLKAIEEPSENTFFILIHDNSYKVLETIKSRCMNFKIHFTEKEKKNIFNSIIQPYKYDYQNINFLDDIYFDTPGNLLKKIIFLNHSNDSDNLDSVNYIKFFIDSYLSSKNPILLNYASFFIEKFYHNLCLKNINNLNFYFQNYSKILNDIKDMKKFNLYEKNILNTINETIQNEKR